MLSDYQQLCRCLFFRPPDTLILRQSAAGDELVALPSIGSAAPATMFLNLVMNSTKKGHCAFSTSVGREKKSVT